MKGMVEGERGEWGWEGVDFLLHDAGVGGLMDQQVFRGLLLSACVWYVYADPMPVHVTLQGPTIQHVVEPEYISANFDCHSSTEETPAWNITSYLNTLDLTDPNLNFLAKEFAPWRLRLGGSEDDKTIYTFNGIPCPAGNELWCLTESRWEALNKFAADANITISFGLNAMYMRNSSSERFDPTQVAILFNYTKDNELSHITAFQFGNELEHSADATPYAQDLVEVRKMLNAVWPDASTRPLLVAPDENPDGDYLKQVFTALPGDPRDTIDACTWHMYMGYGLDPDLRKKMQEAGTYNNINIDSNEVLSAINEDAPGLAVWVGETAAAWHSGQNYTTNAFISSLWYVQQLAILAPTHSVQCRQTFMGGYYELVDKWTKKPNPDYFTALIWKRVVGEAIIATNAAAPSSLPTAFPDPHYRDLYSFSFCMQMGGDAQNIGGSYGPVTNHAKSGGAPQGLAFVLMNLGGVNETYDISFFTNSTSNPSQPISMTPRLEYHLTAPNGQLTSQIMNLNGEPLMYDPSKPAIPDIKPKSVSDPSTPLISMPASITFVVLPNADSPCSG